MSNGLPAASGDEIVIARGGANYQLASVVPVYSVQGNQVALGVQTTTDIFTAISLTQNATYEYYAVIGLQPAAGTAGIQMGVQCSVAGATVEGVVRGPQTTTADASYRQTAQGVVALPIQRVAGAQSVELSGILIAPGSGSPALNIQGHGVQASQAWFAKANCFLRVIRIS
jgi:hypothetical protein